MIRPSVQRDRRPRCAGRCARSGTEPERLAASCWSAGSSRIPLVSQLLSAEFGRPLALDTHPKHDVALGAALRTAQGLAPSAAEPAHAATPAVSRTSTTAARAAAGPVPGRAAAAGPHARRRRLGRGLGRHHHLRGRGRVRRRDAGRGAWRAAHAVRALHDAADRPRRRRRGGGVGVGRLPGDGNPPVAVQAPGAAGPPGQAARSPPSSPSSPGGPSSPSSPARGRPAERRAWAAPGAGWSGPPPRSWPSPPPSAPGHAAVAGRLQADVGPGPTTTSSPSRRHDAGRPPAAVGQPVPTDVIVFPR